MTKDEFLSEFSRLNSHIETALGSHDLDRVIQLDLARRDMLHAFAKGNEVAEDQSFFDALEQCASDNVRAISHLTSQMDALQSKTASRIRGLTGYRN